MGIDKCQRLIVMKAETKVGLIKEIFGSKTEGSDWFSGMTVGEEMTTSPFWWWKAPRYMRSTVHPRETAQAIS